MSSNRLTVLDRLALRILRISLGRPVRIAVDGRTASGKTTLSAELGTVLERSGRRVIRTSIDGFHRPKIERYARGRHSAEGYYYDSRDLAAITTLLLEPLGPSGDRFYRTASFDLDNDVPVALAPVLAPSDAVLVVDGTFLQRPELRDGWDLVIFVETSEKISQARGVLRDSGRLGGTDAAETIYAGRYRSAFALYDRACRPEQTADVVFNNNDVDRPVVRIRQGGRLPD
ncbi:MAG: uridylate kinase [Bradyrhizobium sp.]